MPPRSSLVAALAVAALLGGAVGPAAAEDGERDLDVWSVALLGGAVVPVGVMNESHRVGLLALARLGWTSRYGIGVEVTGGFSPLPRHSNGDLQTTTHHGILTAGPHFSTYWWPRWRVTAAAGGGVAVDDTRTEISDDTSGDTGAEETSQRAILGLAAVSVRGELHLGDRGALTVGVGFGHTFGDLTYRYLDVVSGLIITF